MGVLIFLLPNYFPINLDVLHRPRNIALIETYPMTHHDRAQHVGHKFVALAIPHKQCRTRTAAPVEFEKILLLVTRNLNFILQHAGRPQHAHDVGFFGVTKPYREVRRILSQISIRAVNLKLLPVAARKNFYLRSNCRLVVVQSLQRQPQPVILIPTVVAQQHRRPMILRDEQIGRAVVVIVASDNRPRFLKLNLVEPNVSGDVLESVGAKIAEKFNFALAIFRLADRDEIDPTVVVVVEGSDAKRADPVGLRQLRLLETLDEGVWAEHDSGG